MLAGLTKSWHRNHGREHQPAACRKVKINGCFEAVSGSNRPWMDFFECIMLEYAGPYPYT